MSRECLRRIVLTAEIETNEDTYCFNYDEYDGVITGLQELITFLMSLDPDWHSAFESYEHRKKITYSYQTLRSLLQELVADWPSTHSSKALTAARRYLATRYVPTTDELIEEEDWLDHVSTTAPPR